MSTSGLVSPRPDGSPCLKQEKRRCQAFGESREEAELRVVAAIPGVSFQATRFPLHGGQAVIHRVCVVALWENRGKRRGKTREKENHRPEAELAFLCYPSVHLRSMSARTEGILGFGPEPPQGAGPDREWPRLRAMA